MANKVIAVWQESPQAAAAFANQCNLADALVSVVPDRDSRRAVWTFFRVNGDVYAAIKDMPRLVTEG